MSRLFGAVAEVAWLAAQVALYPTGIREQRASRTAHAGPVRASTPVLLVHGFGHNRSIFTVLRRALRGRGFRDVVAMNYSPLTTDVREAATLLAGRVEQLCAQTGSRRVHVVGHSLGGLIARYYVQRLGGDARVGTLVTLGTPHRGTTTARLLPVHPLLRQLLPGSDLFVELAERAADCRTRFVAFYSDQDLLVPPTHARVDHPDLTARNVRLEGPGHTSLACEPRVVRAVCAELAAADRTAMTG